VLSITHRPPGYVKNVVVSNPFNHAVKIKVHHKHGAVQESEIGAKDSKTFDVVTEDHGSYQSVDPVTNVEVTPINQDGDQIVLRNFRKEYKLGAVRGVKADFEVNLGGDDETHYD